MAGYVDVLLGLQWGDEGKGKIIDCLAPDYDVVARFQGGPNAGHSLVIEGRKIVLHTLPSGVFRDCINLIGNGVVLDPLTLRKEIEQVQALSPDVIRRLYLSRKAHLIVPTHKLLDAASEHLKGRNKIGSTLRGIGPAYMDKTGRNGLRVGDIFRPDFESRLKALVQKHMSLIRGMGYTPEGAPEFDAWLEAVEYLRGLQIVDGEYFVHQQLDRDARILAEGAQGTLLDVDFGTYPFVTSSSTISAGACTGLGVAPRHLRRVFGVFKAYCTRVGSGPFPTELTDETGAWLREKGREFGATTGRPRRCGWLDLPALRYAIMLNGVTDLMMMKADVLSGMPQVLVAEAYQTPEGLTYQVPFDLAQEQLRPQYVSFPGWASVQNETGEGLSTEFIRFVEFVENTCGVPIQFISVGPEREATLRRSPEGNVLQL
ncbi:MAG: adenylosuccinate synthase [Flavobacteriales bacterium]|nr:adenylosuccinate synthase [Flavobacteriales bacterium]MDW8431513.1 adenylosuccinate synthase [Flavobacteriales bacterium]